MPSARIVSSRAILLTTLHFKKLEGEGTIYSTRIGLGYRALGTMQGHRVVGFGWVNTLSTIASLDKRALLETASFRARLGCVGR
jgi:hypothetical protein